MKITDAYKFEHTRGELGRGKSHRVPRSWLRPALAEAKRRGDTKAVEAISLVIAKQDTGQELRRILRGWNR